MHELGCLEGEKRNRISGKWEAQERITENQDRTRALAAQRWWLLWWGAWSSVGGDEESVRCDDCEKEGTVSEDYGGKGQWLSTPPIVYLQRPFYFYNKYCFHLSGVKVRKDPCFVGKMGFCVPSFPCLPLLSRLLYWVEAHPVLMGGLEILSLYF